MAVTRSTWGELKSLINELNPQLYNTVEELELGDDLPLYRATYDYGDTIIDHGVFHVRCEKGILPIDSSEVPKEVERDLNFQQFIPLGIVAEGSMELFIDEGMRTSPLRVFNSGEILASTKMVRTVDNQVGDTLKPIWSAVAGSRSVFSTNKLSNSIALVEMSRHLGIELTHPKTYYDHWYLFKDICKLPECIWKAEIIFFPRQWFVESSSLKWKAFRLFLYELAWKHAERLQYTFLHDHEFSRMASLCINDSFSRFTYKLVKHIASIASGQALSFALCLDEKSFPQYFIEDVLLNFYESGNAYPTFVSPKKFVGINSADSLYYSFAYHTCDETSSALSTMKRKAKLLDESDRLIKAIGRVLLKGGHDLSDTSIVLSLLDKHFFGFHGGKSQGNKCGELIQYDDILIQLSSRAAKEKLELNFKSMFFNGVFQISQKE